MVGLREVIGFFDNEIEKADLSDQTLWERWFDIHARS